MRVCGGFGWGLVLCVVCVVVAGCGSGGGGGLPVGVVAAVGGHRVSLGTLEHWAGVEGQLANEGAPGVADAGWVRPDPPGYAGCIAGLNGGKRPASEALAGRLRRSCRETYRALQVKALTYLLRVIWNEEQAAEQHIQLTSGEVEREYRVFTRREYPVPGELERMLAYAGMSVADEMLRIKHNMLEEKLLLRLASRMRAVAGRGVAERAAQARILIGSQARLLNETNCRAGYVVEVCRQYRGIQRVRVKS